MKEAEKAFTFSTHWYLDIITPDLLLDLVQT